MKNYTCGICGTEHKNRDSYLKCVTNCVAKEKIAESEAKKKRLEEVNAALSKVKAAKSYYEEQLVLFKEKYPEEYKMNFGTENECNCKASKHSHTVPEVFTLSYEDNGKDKPVIKANGKEITDDFVKGLFNDPELKYVGKLLDLLD